MSPQVNNCVMLVFKISCSGWDLCWPSKTAHSTFFLFSPFMKLKVILTDKIARLGNKHDVLDVAKGYAMNYLLPQGLARIATRQEQQIALDRKSKEQGRLAEIIAKAQELKASLAGAEVTIAVKVSDKGALYGSVSEKDVAAALQAAYKVEVAESSIDMAPIKKEGDVTVTLHLAEGVEAPVLVHVTAEA